MEEDGKIKKKKIVDKGTSNKGSDKGSQGVRSTFDSCISFC